MEVKTVDDHDISLKKIAVYAGTGFLIIGTILMPSFFFEEYANILNTGLLVMLLGLVTRTLISSAIAFARTEPVELDPGTDLPKVSIVIPAYNEEPVLEGTIEACRNLDYPDDKLEVIVCYEASSTDRTGEIAEKAAENDPRIKAVERDEPGGGKAKATNYALRYATGDVIASIDADHRFKPDAVKRAVRWFVADDDIWCIKGRCYGYNPRDSVIALHATVERHIAEKGDIFARDVFGGFTIFGGGQAFFRAELFEELGFFDEEILVEDIDMSSKIHAHGKKLKVDPEVITYEENPATLKAWWNQRKRWARGWMQVSMRYLPRLPTNPNISTIAKIDLIYTFSYAIIPAFLVLTIPLFFMEKLGVDTVTYLPNDAGLWSALAIAPVVAAYTIFLQDYINGHKHDITEFIAPFTLWIYLTLQGIVFITAFIEEFVFRKPSVYVTTSRSGGEE